MIFFFPLESSGSLSSCDYWDFYSKESTQLMRWQDHLLYFLGALAWLYNVFRSFLATHVLFCHSLRSFLATHVIFYHSFHTFSSLHTSSPAPSTVNVETHHTVIPPTPPEPRCSFTHRQPQWTEWKKKKTITSHDSISSRSLPQNLCVRL